MAAEGEMAGDTCVPRQAGCAAYSPCLVADAAAVQKVAVKTFCAALDRRFVHEQMMLAYGKPAHHCLKDNETLARKGVTSAALLRDSGATLRITGPVSDGFWVRALVVMAHTTWARRIGLPVSVAYRSAQDAYLDQRDERRDGWTQFFEPISARRTDSIWASPVESLGKHMRTASGGSSGPLVQLDCFAAARAWEGGGADAGGAVCVCVRWMERCGGESAASRASVREGGASDGTCQRRGVFRVMG